MSKLLARQAQISRPRCATCFPGGTDLETADIAREGQPLHSHLSKQQAGLPRSQLEERGRARGSPATGAKGCRSPTGMQVLFLAPFPWGQAQGGPWRQCSRPGGFFSPPWFFPLCLTERLSHIVFLTHCFSLETFFPFEKLFFLFLSPFCFIFPLWKIDLLMRLLASGLSLKRRILPSPFCGLLRASLRWDSVT